MTTSTNTTLNITVPLIEKYFPRIILIVGILSLPTAYLVYTTGGESYPSTEWLLRELLSALMVPIAANLTLNFLSITPLSVGILRSFLFYSGLWMVIALTRGGIFSFPEPFYTLVTSVCLLCALSCLYHYFYTPYLLLQHSFDDSLRISKELIAKAPYRPFRFLLTATVISITFRFVVKVIDPVLETALGITLDCMAENSLIMTLGLLSAAEAFQVHTPTLPRSNEPLPSVILTTLLAPRGILILFGAILLLWQLTSSMIRSHQPSVQFQVISSSVTNDAITITMKVSDPVNLLRGFYPSLFAIAGEQKVLFKEIALVGEFTAIEPTQRNSFKVRPTKEALLKVTFVKSPFSPELWRSSEEFKKLTDLTLWYGDTKIAGITFTK